MTKKRMTRLPESKKQSPVLPTGNPNTKIKFTAAPLVKYEQLKLICTSNILKQQFKKWSAKICIL